MNNSELLRLACCDCGLVHEIAFAIEENGKLGVAMKRNARATAAMRRGQIKYLIFVNDAKESVAGFAYKDDAIEWILAKRWGRHWKIELRKDGESLVAFRADASGVVAGEEGE
jgi:hypothetical protein